MVCVANEVKVECAVCNGTEMTVLTTFTLPASTTIDELYKKVTEYRKCEPDSFKLVHKEVPLTREQYTDNTTLIQLDPECLNQAAVIVFKIYDYTQKPPDSPPKSTREILEEDYERQSIYDGQEYKKSFARTHENSSEPTTSSSGRKVAFVTSPPTKNYVGLVNQAMTCYLNSLLQALYMTPEFRNALYNWEYADGSDKDQSSSIPYQLQKLFLNLQTSTKPAVETTSLTKSFGWDSSEAWQQHDIQELCRVMFDALETKFKNTEHSNLINRLYEGKMTDYVKCLECKTEKTREDTFLDIPLPVRPFESTTAYESVEEALTAFVKYETLDGNNQYHCEKCNKKCDAHKGLKFTKFPYILTLHLKRFDFDYKTLYRMKLNDRVTFPYKLNLNSFIETPGSPDSPCLEEDAGMSVKFDDTCTIDSGTQEDDGPPCNGVAQNNNHEPENDEGIDMSNGISATNGITNYHESEKNREKCSNDEGPYLYDLFSIMIHNGGANGGHYYAYIKDFTTDQWLCFNDTTVNPITDNHIERVYGGGPTKAYSSSTNAYMLMYRQIDPSKNDVPMEEEEFPEHIKVLLQKMKESEDDDKKYEDIQQTYEIKVLCKHPKAKKLMLKEIRARQNLTFAELKEKAYEKFSLYGDVELDQCRLVFYDSQNNLIIHSYNGDDSDLLDHVFHRFSELPELLLEIRDKDQEFEEYRYFGIPLQVYVFDVINEDIIDGPLNVRGQNYQTGAEFKEQLSKIVNIDPQNMSVYTKNNPRFQCLLFKDNDTFLTCKFPIKSLSKIFVTTPSEPVNQEDSAPSNILDLINNFEKVMWLHIQLPNIDQDYTEELKSLALENKEESAYIESADDASLCADLTESVDDLKVHHREKESSIQDNCNGSKDEDDIPDLIGENSKIESVDVKAGMSFEYADVVDGSKEKCCTRPGNETAMKWQGLESASEDSSLSDSEKTLVDNSCNQNNTEFDNLNLYEKCLIPIKKSTLYFKSTFDSSEGNKSLLKIFADDRTTIETLKMKLEKIVGVPVDAFNVCIPNSNSDSEMEVVDVKNKLSIYNNGQRFSIVLGRALQNKEIKLKFYLLNLSCPQEPYKYLFDLSSSKGTKFAQIKEEVIVELKRKHNIEIPFKRLRFRRRVHNMFMSNVIHNNFKFGNVSLNNNNEIAIQELQEDEKVNTCPFTLLFVRFWSRSSLELGPCQEICLHAHISELLSKIESLSNIPEDSLEIANGKGNFPCENSSFLNFDNNLDWRTASREKERPTITLQDGIVIVYRNSKEPLKELSSEERAEFSKKEKLRLNPSGIPNYYNHRREKPLKIYFNSD